MRTREITPGLQEYWDRMTDRARKALRVAAIKANSMGGNYIAEEHLLLALSEGVVAGNILKNLGVTTEDMEREISNIKQ